MHGTKFLCIGARKRQQPAYDFGDAITLLDDAVDHLLLKLRARTVFVFKQLRVIDDAVERVINLVRHARGKFTNRGQLGGLIQLALHLFSLSFESLADGEITQRHDHHLLTTSRQRRKSERDRTRLPPRSLDSQLSL